MKIELWKVINWGKGRICWNQSFNQQFSGTWELVRHALLQGSPPDSLNPTPGAGRAIYFNQPSRLRSTALKQEPANDSHRSNPASCFCSVYKLRMDFIQELFAINLIIGSITFKLVNHICIISPIHTKSFYFH